MIHRFFSLARAGAVFIFLAGLTEAQEPGFFSNAIVDHAPPAGFTTAPILEGVERWCGVVG